MTSVGGGGAFVPSFDKCRVAEGERGEIGVVTVGTKLLVESDVLRNLSNVHSGANRVVAVLDPENGWCETSEHGVIGSRELPVTVVRSTSVPHIAY